MINALKEAAQRCDRYLLSYGVEAVWSLSGIGLELKASYGTESVVRHLDYTQLDQAVDPDRLMMLIETSALNGLSS